MIAFNVGEGTSDLMNPASNQDVSGFGEGMKSEMGCVGIGGYQDLPDSLDRSEKEQVIRYL